jgi:hypothetical protein
MDQELLVPRFQNGDRVRYVGKPSREGWNEDGRHLLLEPGMTGQILRGPEARSIPLNTPERAFYHVQFGDTSCWVRAVDLEKG